MKRFMVLLITYYKEDTKVFILHHNLKTFGQAYDKVINHCDLDARFNMDKSSNNCQYIIKEYSKEGKQ